MNAYARKDDGAARGHRLYDVVALVGAVTFFTGPVLAIISGASALTAASIGYCGIALFTGGVAARYGFAIAHHPIMQVLKNLFVSSIVTALFYAIFLLLFYL